MAQFYGKEVLLGYRTSQDHQHIAYLDDLGDVFWDDRSASKSETPLVTKNSKVVVLPSDNKTYKSSLFKSLMDDFYNRIHTYVSTTAVDVEFGNVNSDVSSNVFIWNSYREPNTLTSKSVVGDSYVFIDLVPPVTFKANEAKISALTTSLVGPSVISGYFILDFSQGIAQIEFTGLRASIFNFQPIDEIKESLTWSTDIISSFNGQEQRIRIRNGGPVQTTTYSYHTRDFDRFKAHFMLQTQAPYYWLMPIWWEGSWIKTPISSGVTSIAINTTTSDFRENSPALVFERPDLYEVVHIDSIDLTPTNQINLNRPLLNSYTNPYVIPLRVGIAMKDISREIFANPSGLNKISMSFKSNENVNLTETPIYPVYRGLYVLTDSPLRNPTLNESYSNDYSILENSTGTSIPVKRWDKSKVARNHVWKVKTSNLWPLRNFFHDCAGKLKPFFSISFENNINVVVQIVNGTNQITMTRAGYFEYGQNTIYRYVYLRTKAGVVFYKKILSVSIGVDPTTEVLTIEEAFVLGATLATTDIDLCCFMSVSRFNTDTIDLNHTASGYTNIDIPTIGIDYDV